MHRRCSIDERHVGKFEPQANSRTFQVPESLENNPGYSGSRGNPEYLILAIVD